MGRYVHIISRYLKNLGKKMGSDLQLPIVSGCGIIRCCPECLRKNMKCKDAEWIWPWLKAISRKQCWFDATFVSTFCNPSCLVIPQSLCKCRSPEDLAVCSLLSSFLEDSGLRSGPCCSWRKWIMLCHWGRR